MDNRHVNVLFVAIIALDVGVFAVTVVQSPQLAVALYLIAYNAVTALLAVVRGVESKLFKSSWVAKVIQGLIRLALAVLCIVFVNSAEALILIFCLCLLYEACVRLASVFKRTEIIYIQ